MATVGDRSRTGRYRSELRARQAAGTRRSVLEAASRLFATQGWVATTVAMVAADAGTSVETIYSGFTSKSQLLSAAIDAALVGDDEPVPLLEREPFVALGRGRRTERLLAAARLIAETHARSVPLLRALQEAAASDTTASARWEQYESDRRDVVGVGLSLVVGQKVGDETLDGVWALSSPEVFAKLVLDRGWPPERYVGWLVDVTSPLLSGRSGAAGK